MLDSEFVVLADRALADIEARLETCGADLDYSMVSDGLLEIEFTDGGKIVVNRHAAAREIWVAGRAGAFHFRWEKREGEGGWRDTREGRGLMDVLTELVSAQAGVDVDLCGGDQLMYHQRSISSRGGSGSGSGSGGGTFSV
jgi:CyaY protein